MRQVKLLGFLLISGLSLFGCDNFAETPTVTPRSDASFDRIGTFFRSTPDVVQGSTRLVYVPVYSRLFLSEASFWEMAASLSIRNTDPDQSLIVFQIDYIDTAGDIIEHYLDTPHSLDPMATATLTLPQWDKRGGTGANFLVRWSGEDGINTPIIEVVMAGTRGTQSFSFIRAGQEITE